MKRQAGLAILFLSVLAVMGIAPWLWAEEAKPSAVPATQPASTTQPAPRLPGITIDRAQGLVDIDAKVNMREGEWIELLVCSPNTRTHESILVSSARPSHVHLALLILGAKPGAPMLWRWEGEKGIVTPAHGAKIAVTLRFQKDGKTVEVPATRWLLDQHAKKPAPDGDNIWLFAGSRFDKSPEGKETFAADLYGTFISLVNFGDDLLVLPTKERNYSGEQPWAPNTAEIPEVGTPVTIRLKPVK